MSRRRTILTVIVLLLLLGNVALLGWRLHEAPSADAIVTHVGLDSLAIEVRKSQPAATLGSDLWEPDPKADSRVHLTAFTESGAPRRVTLVSAPTYKQFIRSIRDLRAHKICNVAIREGGAPILGGPKFGGGLTVPTLVLCGSSIGHDGFSGTLEADTRIRL